MIYIWDENVDFYDGMLNKSDIINRYLTELRNPVQLDIETELQKKLREIDERSSSNIRTE